MMLKAKIGMWVVAVVMFVAGPVLAGSLYRVDFEVTLFGGQICGLGTECDITSAVGDSYGFGGTYYGNLVYDNLYVNSSGHDMLSPGNGLVSVYFDFMGYMLDSMDDVRYPSYPTIEFWDGVFGDNLNFKFVAGLNVDFDTYQIEGYDFFHMGRAIVPWFPGDGEFLTTSDGQNFLPIGAVTYSPAQHIPHRVIPSPAAVSGGLALLFAMGLRRRRRNA